MGISRAWRAWGASCLVVRLLGLVSGLERAGDRTALPSVGVDNIFSGPAARYVVTVEAAGARCAVPADFDGDGDLDIVAVSSNDNTVAWYERLADGSYGPKKMISRASNGARIVTTGDIDQDNRTDVIVASYYDHTVGWFRNLGGSFGSMSMISRSAISAQGVSVADIDNDGDLDVLSASSGDNTVAWYENLGGGRFCEVKNIVDSNSIGVRTVIAADLDEDGYVDLAVASKDDNSISWYRNDHHNRFIKTVIDDTARGAYSLVAKDVDQDGHLDLVTAANMEGFLPDNGEGGKVSFYRNGFGSAGALCNFTKIAVTAGNVSGQNDFDWFVLSVWAGDLDGDGDVDIASASFGLLHQGGVSWYENADGVGNSWIRHQIYITPGARTGHYVFGADMDGDGDNDLIAVTNGDNRVQILTAMTGCDDSVSVPRQECCTTEQYWNGSACLSCPQGQYLDHSASGSATCMECSSVCPRPGLAFQPKACHSIAACGNVAESFSRCDCGAGRYLDRSRGVCADCPDGQVTLGDRTRTPADFAMTEQSFLDQTKYTISDMLWNGFNFSRCQIPQCSAGAYFDMTAKLCQPCSAGSFSPGGSVTSCTTCPAGTACPAGAAGMLTCQAGTFSAAGAESCSPSPPGFVTAIAGMGAPVACEPGTVASAPGLVSCARCSVGSYAANSGQSACTSCGSGKAEPTLWTSMRQITKNGVQVWVYAEGATRQAGDSSMLEGFCTCDTGAYTATSGECVPCDTGLDCPGGPDEPLSLNGFHAGTREELPAEAFIGVESDFSVFRCQDEDWCPGGPIGTCAEGRYGIGCSVCESGKVPGREGKCQPCGGTDYAVLIAFWLGVMLLLAGIFYAVCCQTEAQYTHSTLLILTTSSLIAVTVQQFGVFRALDIELIAPLKDIIDLVSVLTFSLEALRFGCIVNPSPTASYLLNLVPIPVVLLATLVSYSISIFVWFRGEFRKHLPVLIRTLGALLMIFLIATVHIVVAPFQCVPNPNGLWVPQSYPSVICGKTSDHTTMVGVGLATCLLPIGFLALVVMVVHEYPKRIVTSDANFFRAFSFMLVRFNPESVWYVIVFTGRSLLVPLVPLLPDAPAQVLLMALLIGGTAWIQARIFPWRAKVANYLDSIMAAFQLLFLCCLGFIVSEHEDTLRSISVFCSILLICSLCVALITFIGAVVIHIRKKRKKQYQYFICHHKADAAAQARLLKLLLQMIGGCKVFIDSDNLVHLDALLDIVYSDVEHLIVYLTRETLTRPWCAGEVTAAVSGGLSLTTITCPGWAPPDRWQLEELDTYVDLSGAGLMQYGITTELVAESYSKLISGHFRNLNLETGSGPSKFDSLVEHILTKRWTSQRMPGVMESGMVLMSTPSNDDEAMAAAAILLRKTAKDLLPLCPQGACIVSESTLEQTPQQVQQAWSVVVFLSKHSLVSAMQLEVIVCAAVGCENVVPVVLPDFDFPGNSYYDEVLPKVCRGDVESTQNALEEFFQCIALPFSTHADDDTLLAQSRNILDRIDVGTKVSERLSSMRSSRLASMRSQDNVGERRSVGSRVSCRDSSKESKEPTEPKNPTTPSNDAGTLGSTDAEPPAVQSVEPPKRREDVIGRLSL